MKKTLANPWLRIIIISLGIALIYISADFILGSFAELPRVIYEIAILVSVLFPALAVEYKRAGGNYRSFGLSIDRITLKNSLIVIAFLIAFLGILFIYLINSTGIGLNGASIELDIVGVTFGILVYSAIEEVFFRGVIQSGIKQGIGAIGSIIIVSIIFTMGHLLNPSIGTIAIINIFIAGILLGALYEISGSLVVAIVYHFIWNWSTALVFGSAVSGQYLAKGIFDFDIEMQNRTWMGGEFGLEGGILATIILLLSFIALRYVKMSPWSNAAAFKRSIQESELSARSILKNRITEQNH